MITISDISSSYVDFISKAIEQEYSKNYNSETLTPLADKLKTFVELYIDERREQ